MNAVSLDVTLAYVSYLSGQNVHLYTKTKILMSEFYQDMLQKDELFIVWTVFYLAPSL